MKLVKKIFQNNFPFCLGLGMHHIPLTWFEQENLGYRSHFESLSRATWFLGLFTLYLVTQGHYASVLQASTRVHKPSALKFA
jgi:hypothetical protein